MDGGCTSASIEGMVCVEVLPEAGVVPAEEAAVILAIGEPLIHWQVGYRRRVVRRQWMAGMVRLGDDV